MAMHTSVNMPGDLHARWKATGQPLSAVIEWGIDAYWAAVEGLPPDPLRRLTERYCADVWALARQGVITGPPEDDPFPEKGPFPNEKAPEARS